MIAMRPRPQRVRTVLLSIVVAGVLAAVAYVGMFVAHGGRWFVVETPSMGTEAPVGTLLWVEPVKPADLHVGDFVTFRRPDSAETYSHRIREIHADGTISTKGAITAPDPWTLKASDVVGRVEKRWWGIGWLVDALPILVIGGG
ncbi:MAG: S26 family signal peptidase, partial [Williamsia herbipolensis]|nr:S26 family signal peptidase [Williamsia herbipolensis]